MPTLVLRMVHAEPHWHLAQLLTLQHKVVAIVPVSPDPRRVTDFKRQKLQGCQAWVWVPWEMGAGSLADAWFLA